MTEEKERAPEEGDAEAGAEEAGEKAEEGAGAQPIDVFAVVKTCIALLDGHAWQAMGLRPDSITGTTVKNLEQARIAIDCAAALIERVEGELEGAEARELRTLLTNLRLNFVRQG